MLMGVQHSIKWERDVGYGPQLFKWRTSRFRARDMVSRRELKLSFCGVSVDESRTFECM